MERDDKIDATEFEGKRVAVTGGGFRAASEDFWRRDFDISLMAPVRLDRLLVPGMIERKAGAIVHVGHTDETHTAHFAPMKKAGAGCRTGLRLDA